MAVARRSASGLALVGILGLVTPPLTDAARGADPALVLQARKELVLLQGDLMHPYTIQPSMRSMAWIHKRLFTAVRAGYLRFDDRSRFLEGRPTPAEPRAVDPRRDRRGYPPRPVGEPVLGRPPGRSGDPLLAGPEHAS